MRSSRAARAISAAATSDAAGRAEHQRHAGQRGEHEPGQHPVAERLGRVGVALEQDPDAERPAREPEQDHLEQRAPVDAGAERSMSAVEQSMVSAVRGGADVTALAAPPSPSTISSSP